MGRARSCRGSSSGRWALGRCLSPDLYYLKLAQNPASDLAYDLMFCTYGSLLFTRRFRKVIHAAAPRYRIITAKIRPEYIILSGDIPPSTFLLRVGGVSASFGSDIFSV